MGNKDTKLFYHRSQARETCFKYIKLPELVYQLPACVARRFGILMEFIFVLFASIRFRENKNYENCKLIETVCVVQCTILV